MVGWAVWVMPRKPMTGKCQCQNHVKVHFPILMWPGRHDSTVRSYEWGSFLFQSLILNLDGVLMGQPGAKTALGGFG